MESNNTAFKRGDTVLYKDGRVLEISQYDDKRQRVELIEGKYNPFWANCSEVKHTPSPPSERVEDAAALRWVKASERTPEDKKTVFFIVKSTGIRHIGYYHEKTTMFIDEKNRRHYPTHIEWAQEYCQSQPKTI